MSTFSFYVSQPVNAADPIILTVNTDEEFYYLRENVTIYGTIESDGTPVSDAMLAIEVDDPLAKALAFRTVTIGTPPTTNVNIKNVSLTDQYGNPKDIFYIPIPAPIPPIPEERWAHVNVTIETLTTLLDGVTVTFTIYDNNSVCIGSGSGSRKPLPEGIYSFPMSVPIDAWATTGTATIYANVYTKRPLQGGYPLCPEKTATFTIARGSGDSSGDSGYGGGSGATGADGTYECEFRLSPEPKIGTHIVYCNALVEQTQKQESEIFAVRSASYPPQASFTYTPPEPWVYGTITFDASASTPEGEDDEIVSYEWNFGDNEFGYGMIVFHSYDQNGTYLVSLNVTDSEGLWCTTSKPVTVSEFYGPTANFTYYRGLDGTTTFNASSSTLGWNGIGNPPIVKYEWDFGDETDPVIKYYDPIIIHTFMTNDTFTVTLKVTDSEERWDIISKPVGVSVSYGPTADFTHYIPIPFVNGTTTFNASSSIPGWNETVHPPIVKYEWNFGDGTDPVIEYDPITSHTFTTNDTFTVTLNVTDTMGWWDTISKQITISPPYGPTANFTYSPPEPFVNGTTTFNASSSIPGWNETVHPPIVKYEWNFGDGTDPVIEYDPITSHIFTTNDTFTVTLNVTDTMGWWNTTSQNIAVVIASVTHDIAIISVTYLPTVAYEDFTPPIDITAVVRNNGTTPETFNMTAYYNVTETEWTPIETKNVTDLYALAETTVHFTWNTTTLPLYVNYTIKVETSTIQDDTNPDDNTVIPGTIMSKLTGDVDGNGMVSADDILYGVGPAFKSRPGDWNWNPDADFNGNGIVSADDILYGLAPNFGRKYP